MSGITFGSVGDIIAVGQIAWALAQALTSSRGSAKEYQGLVKELHAFDQALLQVVALWQNYENSPELEALGTAIREAITDWRATLLAFRLKFDKKYGTSLSAGGSGNWLKDASKKVVWLKEKEDILELRRELLLASDTLTILILAAIGKSNRLTNTEQAVRVDQVHGLLKKSIKYAEEQMAQLRLIDKKLDSQTEVSNMILTTVKSGVTYLTQVYALAIDMKNSLSLLRSHILSQQATPRGLGTHWRQEPVTLEDALGFIVPIPLELVNSWEMFDIILTKRFEKHPGYSKILRREYAIEETSSGRVMSRTTDWSLCLHPGQKIDMSVVFPERSGPGNHCPRCLTTSTASAEARTQCTSCGMWFQRVTEVDDGEDVPELGEEASTSDQGVQHSRLPGKRISSVIRPADFQRVRMLRKLETEIEREERELFNLEMLTSSIMQPKIKITKEARKQIKLSISKQEEKKWMKLEKERESRMLARERSRRVLLEELVNLSKVLEKIETVEGHLSERYLKAKIERKKQALGELAKEEV